MSFCKISRAYYPVSEMVVALVTPDKQILVHKSQAEVCDECGELHVKKSMYKTQDGYVCEKCFNELGYHICEDCNVAISHFDSVYKGDGKYVCEDCAEDYVRCNFCGQLTTDFRDDNNGTIACYDCLDAGYVHICSDCGCITDDTYTTSDDYDLCEYCYSNHTVECDGCGATYYDEDCLEYDEDEDQYFCPHCIEARERATIHNYSYKPSPKFRKLEKEKDNNEYFGFEIEVEGNCIYAKEFLEKVNKETELVYLKYDGSVNGFEIVTHPMSRGFFYEEFVPKLTEGMEFLRQIGFRGHNRAGIHIHVSSSSISAKMLKNIVNLMYQNKTEHRTTWRKIVQRKQYELDRWASMSPSTLYNKTKTNTYKLIDFYNSQDRNRKPPIGSSKYSAINTNNTDTVEFRVFNSNTRIERIIKNAEVIFSLLDYSKTSKQMFLHRYLDFVFEKKDKYEKFCDFLVEKSIYNPLAKYSQLTLNIDEDNDEDNDEERGAICA